MAKSPSVLKRARQAEKRRLRNRMVRSQVRTAIKKFYHSLAEGDRVKAQQAYFQASRIIDKAASKGVLHKNNAARKKSRLSQKLNQLAS